MASGDELARSLERLDGRSYRAYKDLRGHYAFDGLELFIDHVQGDPFAAPSKVRVRIPMPDAALPAALFETRARQIALEDFLARRVHEAIGGGGGRRAGSGKSGLIAIDAGGQQVLERSAVLVTEDWVEARLEVGLPANGRRISGGEAARLLTRSVPDVAREGICWERISGGDRGDDRGPDALRFVECVENHQSAQAQLADLGLVAFIANGALLPRESGASDRPLGREQAVPFQSPAALEVRIAMPNPIDAHGSREVTGMGIPRGVTLIAGGGYHGKSTLLRALERGVYPHVPGDGRELVVAAPSLVKIRAEDGRRVEQVDIHPFIDALPPDRSGSVPSTRTFSSDDASGSTSQAANIVEAIEAGATGLLLDEDTSATNFMIRDARMQALVHKEHEPITPFVDRVRELWDRHGISTVLVMGGCGDYFDVADRVIVMRDYQPIDATAEAQAIASTHDVGRTRETVAPMQPITGRSPVSSSFDARRGRRDVKIDAVERDRIRYGEEWIDLRGVEQLVDWSQTRAIGLAVHLASQRFMRDGATLSDVLDELDALFDREGLDVLDPFQRGNRTHGAEHPGRLARPRRFEIAAAINRLRSMRIETPATSP